MTAINTCISTITLNINGLHSAIKKQRLTEWKKKQNPSTSCLQETHLNFKKMNKNALIKWNQEAIRHHSLNICQKRLQTKSNSKRFF